MGSKVMVLGCAFVVQLRASQAFFKHSADIQTLLSLFSFSIILWHLHLSMEGFKTNIVIAGISCDLNLLWITYCIFRNNELHVKKTTFADDCRCFSKILICGVIQVILHVYFLSVLLTIEDTDMQDELKMFLYSGSCTQIIQSQDFITSFVVCMLPNKFP